MSDAEDLYFEPSSSVRLHCGPLVTIEPGTLIRDYCVRDGRVETKRRDRSELKVAWVGVWGIDCGISTYSGYLVPEIRKIVKEVKVFAEASSAPLEDGIVRCWKRGEPLGSLAQELKDFHPDIIVIQHEYGIFPVARHWLSLLSALSEFKTAVVFHSVYDHMDKAICEAAAPIRIVHTDLARQAMARKGIGSIVIPHGCYPIDRAPRPYNLHMTNHTMIQFGFGFRYKGWHRSLDVVAKVKETYPDVFFTGVYGYPAHAGPDVDVYFRELQDQIDRLGLRENVALTKGFLPESILRTHLKMNKVAIFPYEQDPKHMAYGCSGAARFAMSCGTQVITSGAPLFYDLRGTAPHTDDPNRMARWVCEIFEGASHAIDQNKFLSDNSWPITAARYIGSIDLFDDGM